MYSNNDTVKKLSTSEALYWENDKIFPKNTDKPVIIKTDIEAAENRLRRFAPLIKKLFPETANADGIIESPLKAIPEMRKALAENCNIPQGKLFIKLDSELAVAGSVKARGGIYEVLKHTEELAFANGIITENDSYEKLADYRDFFSRFTVQVGSTGNLGMSIGISAAALGYKTIVHMSKDAKQWKKDKLRKSGVIVKEYDGDYSKAVAEGRRLSDADEKSYFVDDEKSVNLFLGYATARERLKKQLTEAGIAVDKENKLNVYLPCGVGGAPGGITFGLKLAFGDNVKCYYIEPTECPCVTLSLVTNEFEKIAVQDIGLSGVTAADGLAVQRASGLVCRMTKELVDGCFTVKDEVLPGYMKMLYKTENIFIEPSSCVAFDAYCRSEKISDENTTHIIWATGGSLVPGYIKREYVGF